MAQRLRSRATAAVAAGLAATCIGVAAAPAFADTVRNQEWWLTSLHVTKAWLSSRGTGVKVAVLDTGVDPTQPDLAGSVITGRDYTGSGRTAGGPFWGVHGTAVASIIAGHGHGPHHADGIIGVAPQAQILSVRVTLENKDPLLANPAVVAALPQAIARGISYAVRHGAQVIDLPLDPAAQAGGTTQGGSPAERSAVEAALAKGVVLVAPSGDNGAGTDTVNYPAAYPGVISVGAFGPGFVKAPFTSHQPYATLTAAGNGVIAANGPTAYAKLRSTSAASAVVAGIAALIRSQFPTFTPAQVKQALISGTVFHHKDGRTDGSGFGTADADAALLAAAKINATPTSSASPGPAGNPTPPAAPKVHVPTKSLWQAVRVPALGLAALLLLALIILISVRVRQRRALDAQLAPLQAAARASRTQAAGMTGMGSPGPGYGKPPGSRAPASSEPVGSGPANFGLDSTGLDSAGLAGAGLAGAGVAGAGLAGSGLAGTGAASAGYGFASSGAPGGGPGGAGRPLPGSMARPVVSGKPPWEEDDNRLAPPPAPAPPPAQPGRGAGRFLLPGRGLGSLDAAGGQAAGGPADSGAGGARPGRDSSATGRSAGSDSGSTLNLGGWSLGKPGSGGTGRPVTGRPVTGRAAAGAGHGTTSNGTTGSGTTGSGTTGSGTTGSGTTGSGTTGHATPGSGTTGHATPGSGTTGHATPGSGTTGHATPGSGTTGHATPGSGTTGHETTGHESPRAGSAGPRSPGPLAGIGGTGSNGAAAAARARFGPSPFEDPSFEIPTVNPSASGGSPIDDLAFGAPAPGTSAPGTSAPGTPASGRPAPRGAAEADSPGPGAGNAGSRASGRHGAARGAAGGNRASGAADPDAPAGGRAGDAPAPPMRPLGSVPRLNPARASRPSGHPPWEPAEKPASELPWMDAPASGQSRLVPPRRSFPAGPDGPSAGAGAGGLGAGGLGTSEAWPARRRPRRTAAHDRLGAGPAQAEEPEPVPRPGRSAAGAGAASRQRSRPGGRGAAAHVLVESLRHHGSLPRGASPGRLAPRLARQPARDGSYPGDAWPVISALRTDAYMGTYSWPDRSWIAWMTSSVMARRALPGAVPW